MITSEQAKQMCDRNFGIGGDGVGLLSTVYSLLIMDTSGLRATRSSHICCTKWICS